MSVPSPLVTVVTAAYRADDYLREALASVRAQTLTDFEVIVADDAASSSTRALVADFGDPRFQYTDNVPSLGVAGNHWAAFGHARGRYLAVLNHDDRWSPYFLATLVAPLEGASEVVLAFSDHNIIDAKGRFLATETEATTRRYQRHRLAAGVHRPFEHLVASQSIPMVMAAVFRKSALLPEQGEFFLRCGPAYDLGLALLVCATGLGAYYHPGRLTDYRVHGSSLTTQAGINWAEGSALCWDTLARETDSPAVRHVARARAAEAYAVAALRGMRVAQWSKVRRHALAALRARLGRLSLGVATLAFTPRPFARWILSHGSPW